MAALGVRRDLRMQALSWVAERLGRLKPNGRVVSRSPLAAVIDLEGLQAAVVGKAAGWRSLVELAQTDRRLDRRVYVALAERAERQRAELVELHRAAAAEVLVQADRGAKTAVSPRAT